jgi:hypothetical protein
MNIFEGVFFYPKVFLKKGFLGSTNTKNLSKDPFGNIRRYSILGHKKPEPYAIG